MITFPDGFLWGAATSHFQIEGNPFEIANRCSDWSAWTTVEGHIADHTNADQACEFYNRYLDDIELLSQLNLKAFRLSLNWPTLCPGPSNINEPLKVNREQVEHYRKLLTALKKKGIKTIVTLYHFCLPKHLADLGGWQSQVTVDEFARLAQFVAREYKGLVDYWLTINEPLVQVYQGYIKGVWPPGLKHCYKEAFISIRNLLSAHAYAYQAIHIEDPQAKVSYAMHWRPFAPRNKFSPLDQMVSYFRNNIFNHLFPRSIHTGSLTFPFPLDLQPEVKELEGPISGLKNSVDYLALNYYTREICQFNYQFPFDPFGIKSAASGQWTVDAMGWESYSLGLHKLLTEEMLPYHFDKNGRELPIIITENGYASSFPAQMTEGDWSLDDPERIAYLKSHLLAIHRAIKDGVKITGYLYWSFLDNFEWADGLQMRFGLVRVAFPTQKRTPRKSAIFYAGIAAINGLDDSTM